MASYSNYYDRYKSFRIDGDIMKIPSIKLELASSDLFITYDKSKMRFDNLSYRYYGDPNYAWLILMANPKYSSMEFEIPDRVVLRIPYPLQDALQRYETKVQEYLSN